MTDPSILFLSHTGSLGGAELSMLDIAEHFRETATFVLFQDGPFRERLQKRGVSVEVVPASVSLMNVERDSGPQTVLRAIPEVVRLTARVAKMGTEHDLLYATSQKALIVASLSRILSRTPMVWHLHDILSDDHFSPLNQYVSTRLANYLVERVVVNSKATKAAFESCGGDGERAEVVHYGIESTAFDGLDEETTGSVRQELSLPEAPLVGVFSRLTEWKGQHVLVRALPDLPEVHAILVGDSLFEDGEDYVERLQALARDGGVRDRVHFLGFREDVPRLMKAVDVVLHTSTDPEPFGRVIVEGMLAQRPVVATKAGGAEEIVDHEDTGLLVPPGDVEATTRAIRRLLTSSELADTLAQQGYEHASSHFAVSAMTRRIERCVSEVWG